MCGIAGIIAYRQGAVTDEREVLALRDAQLHRGPDDAGLWLSADRSAGLGHRRLSIIDLSPAGHQPMASEDGALQLVFNGEIYNFGELRRELEGRGFSFRSNSDTEVILHGYRAFGHGLLDRLRGMFAFALYDARERELWLARDPFGIKPLYTADDGARLLFASEVQALRRVTGDGGLDPEGLASYLMWGSIAPPRTLYRRIRALPAGSSLRVREGGPTPPRPWFSLASCFGRSRPMAPAEAGEALREALLDSVRAHRVADVPVGAFLSGGVDSSALLGLLSEVGGGGVRTVTLAFDRPELDEGPLARQAADFYGADHREIAIRIDEIRERLPDAVRALDQPSVDGVNTYFVSEAAAKAGLKVAVSGVGGDELFGGYASFERVPQIRETHRVLAGLPLGTTLLPAAARMLGSLPATRGSAKLALALEFGGEVAGAYFAERGILTPRQVRRLLAPELAEAVEAVDPVLELARRLRADELPEEERVSALEISQYLQCQLLRDTDAVSMRHSLEVRTPLVDRTLLEAVARVPAALRRSGPAKRWLREAPRPPVPAVLWDRRKQGFDLPYDHWLRSGSIPIALPEHPWLQTNEVQRIADGFQRGRLHSSRLWLLLVLGHFLGHAGRPG
jgi:asparagine synthase (glutamine-hydrolysing)